MTGLVRLGGLGLLMAASLVSTGAQPKAFNTSRRFAVDDTARRISSSRAAELDSAPPTAPTTSTTTTSTTAATATRPPRSAPAPAPPPTTAPALADGDPGTSDLLARARAALESAVPSGLRDAYPVRLELVGGATSWSSTDGSIRVSGFHAKGPWWRLRAVITHEWGHQTAYRDGSHRYLGAPPDDWPYDGPKPQEAWADCVAVALIGINPSGNAGECHGPAQDYIAGWLPSHSK